jgi:hypothetical protein
MKGLGSRLGFEPVTDPRLRHDQPRLRRIDLELAAEVIDVDAELR